MIGCHVMPGPFLCPESRITITHPNLIAIT